MTDSWRIEMVQDCKVEGSIHTGVSSTKGSWEKVELLTHIWNTEEIRMTQKWCVVVV